VVKNRSKDGGYYWVHANVMPVIVDNQITGYASVRVAPTREQIEQAKTLYDAINAGRLKGRKLKHGVLVPTGWRVIPAFFAKVAARGFIPSIARMTVLSILTVSGLAAYTSTLPGASPW